MKNRSWNYVTSKIASKPDIFGTNTKEGSVDIYLEPY